MVTFAGVPSLESTKQQRGHQLNNAAWIRAERLPHQGTEALTLGEMVKGLEHAQKQHWQWLQAAAAAAAAAAPNNYSCNN